MTHPCTDTVTDCCTLYNRTRTHHNHWCGMRNDSSGPSHDEAALAWLESRDFYEMCQQYRHADEFSIPTAAEAFEGLKLCIADKFCPLSNATSEKT